MRSVNNSIILVLYLFIAFLYYVVESYLRYSLFGVISILSLYVFFTRSKNISKDAGINKAGLFLGSFLLMLIVFLIQFYSGTLTPFIFYIITAPSFAYFILENNFKTKIFTAEVYLVFSVILIYYLLRGNFENIFSGISANYISVVAIMHIAVLQVIQYRQKEKVSLIIPFIALITSILAVGRSGIICSALLLVNTLVFRWNSLTKFSRYLVLFFLLTPILFVLIFKWGDVVQFYYSADFFSKFHEDGLVSYSRNIIIREYMSNINWQTALWGYNFSDNYWFIHYGQNPHNSFIRLHHFTGLVFFPIVILLVLAVVRLIIKKRYFLSVILITILVRAWTDSILFLAIYDFVWLFILFVSRERK